MIKKHLPLCVILIASLLPTHTSNGQPQVGAESASVPTEKVALKWNTIGLRRANIMGGGEAAISKSGKFRVFVLMGQSNMTGAARAAELASPYIEEFYKARAH